MTSLKQKFAAVAMSAALSFNSVAANAEPQAPDAAPVGPITQADETPDAIDNPMTEFGLYLDELGDFPVDKSTAQIQAELLLITNRIDASDYLDEMMNSNDYVQIESNIFSAEQLDNFLDNTAISPYYVMPLIAYGSDKEKILNPEMIDVLEKHGLDLKDVDTMVNVSTNGRKHLYDYTVEALETKLDSPYIKSSLFIQQNGYSALPAPVLRDMQDDLALSARLKAIADPLAPELTLDDVVPRGYDVMQESLASMGDAYQFGLNTLSDASYKTALYGRDRQMTMMYNGTNGTTVKTEDVLLSGYGADLEGGIAYHYSTDLNLPEQKRDFDLVVTEPKELSEGVSARKSHSFHGDITMRMAEALSTQISPDGEGDSDVHFIATNVHFEISRDFLLLSQLGKDKLIYSQSTGLTTQNAIFDDDLLSDVKTRKILKYNFHEQNETMNVAAAGNEYTFFSGTAHGELDVDPKVLMAASSVANVSAHAQRGVTIGAAHIDDADQIYMSSYSSPGAAFLVETPDFYHGEVQGTSFSTPTAASYYKEIAESYGDELTHEEMIFAGLYSTNTDIYNINQVKAEELDHVNPVKGENQTSSYGDALNKNEKAEISPEELTKFDKTVFRTNAASVPYHERAGAGFLDVYKWKDNLDAMKAMKNTFEHQPEFIKDKTPPLLLGESSKGGVDTEFPYHYEVRIEHDMTLDKQTLYLDQVGLNALRITSPSGMESDFVGTASGYISTRAFSGEDVQAGDVLTIQSKKPLGELAEFTARGTADGSVIQAFREYQLADKGGLEVNQTYQGGQIVPEANKSPDGNLIRQAQSVYDMTLNAGL